MNNETICKKHNKAIEGTIFIKIAFCNNDYQFLCINCILNDGHKDHQFQSIDESFVTEQEKFIKPYETILGQQKKLSSAISQMIQLNNDCEKEREQQLQQSQKYFNSIRNYINGREAKQNDNVRIVNKQINQYILEQQSLINNQLELYKQIQNDYHVYLQMVQQNINQNKWEYLSESQFRNHLLKNLNLSVSKPSMTVKLIEFNAATETNKLIQYLTQLKNDSSTQINSSKQKIQSTSLLQKQKISDNLKYYPSSKQVQQVPQKTQKQQIQPLSEIVANHNPYFSKQQIVKKKKDPENHQKVYWDKTKPKTQSYMSALNFSSQSANDIGYDKSYQTVQNSIKEFESDTSQMKQTSQALIIGGYADDLEYAIEQYQISENYQEQQHAQCFVNRCKFGVCNLKNGNFLLIGGKIDGIQVNSCQEYDIKQQLIIESPIKLPKAKSGFGCINRNNNIIVIGGNDGQTNLRDVDCYDQNNGIWNQLHPLQDARDELAVCVHNNLIFAIGGFGGQNNTCLKTVEVYKDNKWTFYPSLNVGRRNSTAVSLPDGIYVMGGVDGPLYLNSVEKYENDHWVLIQTMQIPRSAFSALVSQDLQYIYVFGGFNNKALESVERYSLLTDQWEIVQSMKSKRYMHQCFEIHL